MEAETYSIYLTDELQEGFHPLEVRNAFADLFGISQEKANTMLKNQQMVKKGIDLETAIKYKEKLESIGLVIDVQEHPALGLSLTTVENEDPKIAPSSTEEVSKTATINCPKCNTEQAANSQECPQCGILIQKVLQQAVDTDDDNQEDSTTVQDREDSSPELTPKSIMAGSAAAFLGALLWKFIAIQFNYELGLVAWVIGGAIGFAVASTGSCGKNSGIACGILALLAIMGGKFMLYSSYHSELSGAFEQAYIEASVADFQNDGDFTGEDTDAYEENITQQESSLSNSESDFDKIGRQMAMAMLNPMQNMSTFDLVKESFGILDVFFLLLGISTAFQIGRGKE